MSPNATKLATPTHGLVNVPPKKGGPPIESLPTAIEVEKMSFYYGQTRALFDISVKLPAKLVTAFIGPSGCGKSTFLRTLNRMNDIIPGARATGMIMIDGKDLYGSDVDPVALRRDVGMVFQKSNPFPKSIYDNIAYGPKINGRRRGDMDDIVEHALTRAALWEEVKDKLKKSALALSGGQQQRLCIARALAVEPDVILMDEPCSALDPIATLRIEELIAELKSRYTIVLVTHNMQQAARVADTTAFMLNGELVEHGPTGVIFTKPNDSRTEEYVTGKFG